MNQKEYCAYCKWYEQSMRMRTYDENKGSADVVAINWSCEDFDPKEVLFVEE